MAESTGATASDTAATNTAGDISFDGTGVSILMLGTVSASYNTIPSFSAIQVSLRQVTVQVELSDGSGRY